MAGSDGGQGEEMIKLVIFDWDDVFTLGAKQGYFELYHEVLTDLSVHLDPKIEQQRILAKWSKHYREELKELLQENPHMLDKACRLFKEKFFSDTVINSLIEIPGVNKLLERLSKKYILCIATGQHPKNLKKIISKFNIPKVFSQTITTYDISDPKKQKPHPYTLEKIIKTQRVKPEETIFVGDASNDVLMAQNAGVTPVVVLTGHLSKKEAEKLGVKYIIENVTYLEDVLEKLK